MKLALLLFTLSAPSCAYWHFWRNDETEMNAVDVVNMSAAGYPVVRR